MNVNSALAHMACSLGLFFTLVSCGWAQNPPQTPAPAVTWENLDARMQWEVDHGFAGVVLVAREGKVVFHKAYGMANREQQTAMRPDTILAIGSTPIDFTKAGILLLAQQGKLNLDDSITKYFKNVPDDKQAMTLRHLMTGRSGLRDFHDVPSDRDKDHSWIDRDEAVRRILGQKLLFAPGKGREHSHSAFGLLAAVLEIVSGQTYQEFTRQHLFQPAGMKDTGFFGESYPAERMAVGYGPRKDGTTNAPPFWGKTSWLVMGSGGQVSTAEDMWRWMQFVRGGKLLTPESLQVYGPEEGILAGGDMYGFEILYAGNPQSFMVVMSNTGSPRRNRQLQQLARDLSGLIRQRPAAKFTLGVELRIDEDTVTVNRVIADGPAAKAGLRAEDILLKAGGKSLKEDPQAVLGNLLRIGDPFELEVERDGKTQRLTITPVAR